MDEKTVRSMIIGLIVLTILTPLGLLASGTAFGEWSPGELMERIGYSPSGMQHLSSTWNAPIPDYAIPGLGTATSAAIGYAMSAVVGVALCAGLLYVFGRKLAKDESD